MIKRERMSIQQRMILLDVILSGNCTSRKEIYYKASKLDPKIKQRPYIVW